MRKMEEKSKTGNEGDFVDKRVSGGDEPTRYFSRNEGNLIGEIVNYVLMEGFWGDASRKK